MNDGDNVEAARRGEAAGCKYVQIDEPLFATADDREVEVAVEAINMAVDAYVMKSPDFRELKSKVKELLSVPHQEVKSL